MPRAKRWKGETGKVGKLAGLRRNLALVRTRRGQDASQGTVTGRLDGAERIIGLLRDLAAGDGQATARHLTGRAGLDWRTCGRLIAVLEDADLSRHAPKRKNRDDGMIFQLVLIELLAELVEAMRESEGER